MGMLFGQPFVAGEGKGEAVGQLVRGGLYEVELVRRRMRCVYWPEHAHRIHRGTWFMEKGTDWVPLKVGSCLSLQHLYFACAYHVHLMHACLAFGHVLETAQYAI